MTCAACVNSVEGILIKLPGIKRATFALATSLGEVEYDPAVTSKDDIVNAIEDTGFEVAVVQSGEQDKIFLVVAGLSTEFELQLLDGILRDLKGVRQSNFNKIQSELEVLFDPERIGSRSIVDMIEGGSNGKFEVNVQSPYSRMTSNNTAESSNMFKLFISSLILSA